MSLPLTSGPIGCHAPTYRKTLAQPPQGEAEAWSHSLGQKAHPVHVSSSPLSEACMPQQTRLGTESQDFSPAQGLDYMAYGYWPVPTCQPVSCPKSLPTSRKNRACFELENGGVSCFMLRCHLRDCHSKNHTWWGEGRLCFSPGCRDLLKSRP